MPWQVSLIGKPADIVTALQAEVANYTGESRIAYEAALPHLVALVSANFVDNSHGTEFVEPTLRLDAGGGTTLKDGAQIQGSCVVQISFFTGKVVGST